MRRRAHSGGISKILLAQSGGVNAPRRTGAGDWQGLFRQAERSLYSSTYYIYKHYESYGNLLDSSLVQTAFVGGAASPVEGPASAARGGGGGDDGAAVAVALAAAAEVVGEVVEVEDFAGLLLRRYFSLSCVRVFVAASLMYASMPEGMKFAFRILW